LNKLEEFPGAGLIDDDGRALCSATGDSFPHHADGHVIYQICGAGCGITSDSIVIK